MFYDGFGSSVVTIQPNDRTACIMLLSKQRRDLRRDNIYRTAESVPGEQYAAVRLRGRKRMRGRAANNGAKITKISSKQYKK